MKSHNEAAFLVDAHVHYYGCYDLGEFLEYAVVNFCSGARELGLAREKPSFLLLAETVNHHYFRQFRDTDARESLGQWSFRKTAEDCSLVACRDGCAELVVISGRQIVTQENLEVLAVGTTLEFPEGLPLEYLLNLILESGALPVVPWGFGKWWFRRGHVVAKMLRSTQGRNVFLGDNSGRPWIGPRPKLFALAQSRGIAILPGSDPLPFPSQLRKVGAYGFALEAKIDYNKPTECLNSALCRNRKQPPTYGQLERLGSFCNAQVQGQIRKLRS